MLCAAMVVGSTYAWFTSSVTSNDNIITSGKLDIDLLWTADLEGGSWTDTADENAEAIFNYDRWEPGYTEARYFKVKNAGDLAFKYALQIVPNEQVGELADVIDVYYIESPTANIKSRHDVVNMKRVGTLKDVIDGKASANGVLLPQSGTDSGEIVLAVALKMQESAGNEYMGKSIGGTFNVVLYATQYSHEQDAFGSDYDSLATHPDFVFPDVSINSSASGTVTVDADGKVSTALTLANGGISADIPVGVKVAAGTTELKLSVSDKTNSDSNVNLGENDAIRSLDVHIEGVAQDNTVPMTITLEEVAPIGLNLGNLKLYHVENGSTVEMTKIDSGDAFTAHNQFKYDPATGDIVLYMATFSEVAVVADTENMWKGEFDYNWYDAEETELEIANADQLAGFGAIVGGMAEGIEIAVDDNDDEKRDSFAGKTVKLIADVNLGDIEKNNNEKLIFYPIGYYNSTGSYEKKDGGSVTSSVKSFEGKFDGAGHTVANFYQNTWEMFGDYNDGYSGTPNYYKDGMGLFGYVMNGTVKNLTVDNFSSDGEFTPTGVIAAFADGDSNFENIAITNCNPRVYNTGNGGIIGIAGDTGAANDDHITLKNITVDNSNKISALWGSWDVACGGLVGMYRGNVDGNGDATGDTISFDNCHVSAQIDVYNDVCANYQYYAYRYAGMIIGSVRHNTTNNEGKTIPNMAGISATGCTVNYGDWNDYYYCEFEKNTMASYSEDYQFSRVPHSELNFTDSNGNGVIDADERASVTGCKHTHTAEENHQAIYLPFHQLFTGYSWGVSSIGLENYSGIATNLDITEGDQEKSVEKFEGKVSELSNNTAIKLGDIFSFVDNGVELKPAALTVTVTDLDESDGIVAAEFDLSKENWENSTLKLTGIGKINITIQDYYFCIPTTITVNVADRQPEVKFETKFTGDFLYRVGNQNTVELGSLFKAKEGVEIGNVDVTFDNVAGNASGAYNENTSDWTKETIKFEGTGVVKVSITDNDYCTPTELTLEVVDATNITSATGTTTGGNFVLLCDVNTSTYVNYWNCTVYGNGFTYSLKGAPTAYNSKQGKGILITKNATLDNIKIIGDIYNSYGAYTNQDYYNTAIDVTGDTTIQNCYIANCSAPVRARDNVTIKNTTLYGGAVGNLIIESGVVTLENVTTANYDDGRALVGMGIVVHSDATESAKLVLNGELIQYNFISESKVPTDTYAKNLHEKMFSTDCSQYQFGSSPNRFVNTGIISLSSNFNREDITDNAKTGYVGKNLTVSSYDGYVYTQSNTNGSVNNNYQEYKPTTQGTVSPSYSFDFTNKNYIAKTDGSNDYCYEENGKVNISMDDGDTFNWDTSILTIGKGITDYTVSMNGIDYTGKSIAFNAAGDYEVTYTYTDDNNSKFDENGNITSYSVTYTKTVNITVSVVKATTKHAEFTFGRSNTASTTVTIGNNTYVMPNVSGTSSTIGSTTVSGQTIYYPIVEIIMSDGKTSHTSGWYAYFPVFSGTVTITDYANNGTGDKMTPYGSSTTTMPEGLSVVGDPKTLFKYQSGNNAGETPVLKNNILVYSSAKIEAKRAEYNTVIQYSYKDNAGTTYYYYIGYHAPAQSYSNTCVTPDTLITLADGSQVRVDSLNGSEQLLVWNMETGKFDSAPIAYVVNHNKEVKEQEITRLLFSDGNEVKVIGEHVFFNATLNKYVAVTGNNAESYIGHSFIGINNSNDSLTTVKLVEVDKYVENTESYEVVSYKHLTCFTNNILSTSAYLDKLLNIFEISPDTMAYSAEIVQKDIETYGLYTYSDFEGLISEEAFNLYNAPYLKVAVGKGYITWDDILDLIDIFFTADVNPL